MSTTIPVYQFEGQNIDSLEMLLTRLLARNNQPQTPLASITTAPVHTNVSIAASSTIVLAANTARKGFVIYNDSSQDVYIKYGTGASLTSFVYRIPANTAYEPSGAVHTGVIYHIAAAASGTLRVTEMQD